MGRRFSRNDVYGGLRKLKHAAANNKKTFNSSPPRDSIRRYEKYTYLLAQDTL